VDVSAPSSTFPQLAKEHFFSAERAIDVFVVRVTLRAALPDVVKMGAALARKLKPIKLGFLPESFVNARLHMALQSNV
jgi:hypothetical protein